MRNPSSMLTFVLTAVLTLPFTMQLSAQQTSSPATGTAPPIADESPTSQTENQHGPMHLGDSVQPPVIIRMVPPQFSEEARTAKFSGTVRVYCWVDENGNPSHVRVVRGIGRGLDEKAVEAVRQYKFRPATQNGKAVKVDMYIDVNFQVN